jgi:hypothetical protein
MTQQINNLHAGKWYCNWTRKLKFVQYTKKCTYHSISRVHLLKQCLGLLQSWNTNNFLERCGKHDW